MAPSTTYSSAKELLDKIGQQVHEEVEKEAEAYKEALKGDLSNAKFENEPKGQQTENDPCKLDYQYHTNVTSGFGREYPCRNGTKERFSDTEGAQCDDRKIRGSDKTSNGGACAPYRRLHLCVRNLENISALDKINNDTLLVDVCMAAKFEGASITGEYPKYQDKYGITGSTMCTMLARSFADIGDIIRGKDLYIRNKQEKDRLQSTLKRIFQKIYNNLVIEKPQARERYKDENGGNYFQLREDWWTANRETVWKAITCDAKGSQYFRPTCGGDNEKNSTLAKDKCRCEGANANQVPTYFDYVPQYLRWFEEWAEDFCRKRKHKLQNAKEQCRGDNGRDKYCDFNGYDCKGTASGKHKYRWDNACAGCLFSCSDFRKWIKNEKNDFKRQKEKYNKEINEKDEQKVTKHGTINNIYAKKFYDELEKQYGTVDLFLTLLNNEKQCENHPEVGEGKKTSVDFSNINVDETFSHTEICEPCPWCGIKKENGTWERINNHSACQEEELYTPKKNAKSTKINVLTSGEGHEDIAKRLKEFCTKTQNGVVLSGGSASNSDSQKLYEEWKCYKHNEVQKVGEGVEDDKLKDAGGLCILENKKHESRNNSSNEPEQFQKTFNNFFNFWVAHVLNDSIDWRTQLTKCLSEDKLKKCEKGCKSNCECFKKWIRKKETEWTQVKNQFNDQPDFQEWGHYFVLEKILEDYYFENIQKAYGDLKSIQEMKKMIKENQKNTNRSKDDVDALDVLFDHELEEAEDCLDIHDDEDGDGNTCVEESEKIPNNPCSGTRHRAMVKNVAEDMHLEARQQLRNRGGRKALKADASKGTYKKGGNANMLSDICNITDQHSNDERNTGEPCHGKDKPGVRFEIGTEWKHKTEINMSDEYAYMPPRRQHMCTSNLENLQTKCGPLNGNDGADKVNHSFLGDVLLSAKYEAKKIKELYKQHNGQNDHIGMCRAIRYSFADLGDIIRGRDLWDEDKSSTDMEKYFVPIFEKIKEQLPQKIKEKYNGDDKTTHKYKRLREDWWTANRRQVWKAMKCAIEKDKNLKCNGIPIEDYIPQRLRWMTEWSEWFCKMQSVEYEKLMGACGSCKNKNDGKDCTQKDRECTPCKTACDKYKKEINKWKRQWNKMQIQYTPLYLEAQRNSAGNAYPGADYQQMLDFFKKLQKEIKNSALNRTKRSIDGTNNDPIFTSPYSSAEGYIHQELPHTQCDVQKYFCNTNGNQDKYVFREKPKDHDEACGCESRKAGVPKQKEEPACKIVDDLFSNNTALKEACALKYGKKSYFGWNCNSHISSKTSDKDNGSVCIPPRRQKLYTQKIQDLDTTSSSQGELRTAFIQCAAVETFFLWHKYKMDKKKEEEEKNEETSYLIGYTLPGKDDTSTEENLQKQLKQGTIPEDFIPQMFYTFGDYKDIFFGRDMSRDMDAINEKIKDIFPKGGEKAVSGLTREISWEEYGPHIWEAMLCALSYNTNENKIKIDNDVRNNLIENPKNKYQYSIVKFDSKSGKSGNTLSDFAKIPQFIRWFEEWAEEFCQKKKIKIEKIKNECRSDREGKRYCSGDGYDCTDKNRRNNDIYANLDCLGCEKECTIYKKWIKNKEKEFDKQRKKCEKLISHYNNEHDKESHNYLKTKGYTSINSFLESLNQGKECQVSYDETKNTDFKKNHENFLPSTYCKACPVYGVHIKMGKYTPVDEKQYKDKKGTGKKETNTHPTGIKVLVLGRKGEDNDNEFKKFCINADLFEDASFQKWECQKKKGIDQCKLTKFIPNIDDDDKEMEFYIFFHRWLRDFVQDYNKLKDKINPCINKDDGIENTCIEGCNNKCECVNKWLKKKEDEWNEIKSLYRQYSNISEQTIAYRIKSLFEQGTFPSDAKEAKEVVKDEREQEKLWGCTGVNTDGDKDECKNGDFITNLIDRLQNKLNECKKKSEETQQMCDPFPPTPENREEHAQTPDDYTPKTTDDTGPLFCPKEKEPPVPPVPPDACEIVDGILKGKDKNSSIEDCKHKYDPNKDSYPKWNCTTSKFKNGEEGACMPPRRQKLCIHNLEHLSEKATETELRKAFIECAAIETFWLWHKYKEDKENDKTVSNQNNDLKKGIIPEDFKRQMFYTFGDYRDLCVGTDISSKGNKGSGVGKVEKNIDKIFTKKGEQNDTKRKEFWNKYAQHIWDAMVCSLTYVGGNKETLTTKYTYSTIKFSGGTNPPTLEKFAQTPQFLRWFTEWGEDFCKKRKEQLKKLEKECPDYTCSLDSIKEQCEKACKEYQAFINKWKPQYEQQREKFRNDKKEQNYKHYPSTERAVQKAVHAHEYLNQQLQNICKNGDCSCMKNPSTHSQSQSQSPSDNDNDMPESLDYPPEEFKNKCKCPECPKKDCKSKEIQILEPKIPMNCVEKAAYYLAKEEDKYIERTLKQKITHYNYIKKNDNSSSSNNNCDPNKPYSPDKYIGKRNPCDDKGNDRFNLNNEWKCSKFFKNYNERFGVCVPPRRRHMCLRNLDEIEIAKVNQSNYLLNIIRITARNEGIDIIKKFKSQNSCVMNPICDTMKYSFADLGDIIRGRDMFRIDGEVPPVEKKLKEVFETIYAQWKSENTNNKGKYPDVTSFRSAWWHANRKEIWKAMTRRAPEDAKLFRTEKKGDFERITLIQDKCGHNDDPPVDDYIPQRLRWMKEWGEYVCKILNEKINDIKKECDKCNLNDNKCSVEDDGNKCKSCNEKCREYIELIQNLKSQFNIQKQKYNELSKKAENNRTYFRNDNDKNVIQFLKKVKEKTECDVKGFDEYLDKSIHCIHYKFNEKEKDNETYAFNIQPEKYKTHCTCTITNHPLDKCPDKDIHNVICKPFENVRYCSTNNIYNNDSEWDNILIKNNTSQNKGVLLPPRRRYLCMYPFRGKLYKNKDPNTFKKDLLDAAYSQGRLLGKKYPNDNNQALQAMKYSFADYGDIAKGTDMMTTLNVFQLKLEECFKTKYANNTFEHRKNWWEENKTHVWHAMLCGYKVAGGKIEEGDCSLPEDDKIPQFLRWFQEWTENFCIQRKKLYDIMVANCKEAKCDENTGKVDSRECAKACRVYEDYVLIKKKEYEIQKDKYDTEFKNKNGNDKDAPDYFKNKCNGKTECLSEYFSDEKKWKNPYESFNESTYKDKCDCQKTVPPPLVPPPPPPKSDDLHPQADEPFNRDILEKTIPFGIAFALGSIAFLFLKVKVNIYVWGICLRVGVFGYIYVYIYIYFCICM